VPRPLQSFHPAPRGFDFVRHALLPLQSFLPAQQFLPAGTSGPSAGVSRGGGHALPVPLHSFFPAQSLKLVAQPDRPLQSFLPRQQSRSLLGNGAGEDVGGGAGDATTVTDGAAETASTGTVTDGAFDDGALHAMARPAKMPLTAARTNADAMAAS